jgi:hypothetical protein
MRRFPVAPSLFALHRVRNPVTWILGRLPIFRAIRQSDILMTTREVMRMSDFRLTKKWTGDPFKRRSELQIIREALKSI